MYMHTNVRVRLRRFAPGVTTLISRNSDPSKDDELTLYSVRAFFLGMVGPSMHFCSPTLLSRVVPGDNFVAF